MINKQEILKSIPSVDEIIKDEEMEELISLYSRNITVKIIREYLDKYRQKILSMDEENLKNTEVDPKEIILGIKSYSKTRLCNSLKAVVNASGVVIHTNLGRAPLSQDIKEDLYNITFGYSNLEMDLEKGVRGLRYTHIEEILKELTKAEAAMVVNNNAAAVLLVLSTMAKNKEVIVSRGQLIEIGGSFRIPDVMIQSGAKLVEVGTTNKTHIWDYEKAINEETALLMKVHSSNYKILGFTEEVSSNDLVSLGINNNIPVIEDIGSGVFIDLGKYGLTYEPTVQNAVASGMDIVTFSGDKMLGGPQAGIIVGKKEYIDEMQKNPLTRAFRIDKMTLAALEGTLKLYLDEEKAIKHIPVLNMLTTDLPALEKKAEDLFKRLNKIIGASCSLDIEDDYSEVGGGALPLEKLPTKVITIEDKNISANEIEKRLRYNEIPVIARIAKDKVIIDLRTVFEKDYKVIEAALINALM